MNRLQLVTTIILTTAGVVRAAPPAVAEPTDSSGNDTAAETPEAEPAGAAEVERVRVAVLEVQLKNIDAETGSVFDDILSAELSQAKELQVISAQEVIAMLGFESDRQVMGCEDDSCIAEWGGALGVDKLVLAQVARVGETYVVSLKIVAVREAVTEQRIYETVEGRIDDVLAVMRTSARKLAGLDSREGGSAASASSAPATAAGSTTRVSRSGGGGGVPIVPIVVMAAGAVAAGVGGYFTYAAHANYDAGRQVVGSQQQASSGTLAAWNQAATEQTVAFVLYGIGGAAIVTGVVLLFVLGGDDDPPAVAFAPVITPRAAGAVLTMELW